MTDISNLITQLQQDQVIAYPTEAVFGLGCNPLSESAVQNLLLLKRRPIEKGLILIAPTLDFLLPFIDGNKLNSTHWTRLQQTYLQPTTWVVPANPSTPQFLTGQFASIAVRLCTHPAVVQLCQAAGFALTSTSANLSGLPPCKTVAEVRSQFGKDFPIFEGEIGTANQPSTIKDIFTQQIFR